MPVNGTATIESIENYVNGNSALKASVGCPDDVPLTLHHLGAGEHNLNYILHNPLGGRRHVLRVNVLRQPFHHNQVAYEFGILKCLAGSGCTPQPVYLDDSAHAPGYGAMVIGFCQGQQLDLDHPRPGDLRCTAQLLADVHSVEVDAKCPIHRPADALRELFDECLQRFDVYLRSAFQEPRITRWGQRFIDAAAQKLDTPFLPADSTHVVSSEPLPSSFLIPQASAAAASHAAGTKGRFCDDPGSMVDWERAIVGEVAQDIAYFTSPTSTFWDSDRLFTHDDALEFAEDYWRAVDGRFDRGCFAQRFEAYRAMTALRSITWCCKATTRYKAADFEGHKTDRTMAKLPIYLSDDFLQLVFDDCFGHHV